MKKFLITFLFLIFATNNILLADECVSGNCVNGQGTLKFADGNKYVGEFKDGSMHGRGTYITQDDAYKREAYRYVGEWKNNKRNGQGKRIYENGGVIEGEFKDDKLNGQATLTIPNGNKYVGEWKDDEINGQGTYTYENGDKYVGEWKNGKYDGQGTLITKKGKRKYIGGWKDDEKNGQGTITYKDGTKYVGEWKEDRYDGQGTITYKGGHKYVGEWKNGLWHGQGTWMNANGNIRRGEWAKGKKVDGKSELILSEAGKKEQEEYEKRKKVKGQNNAQRANRSLFDIKTEAVNAIDKAQNCYNSLDSIGQRQISKNLRDAKITFNKALKLEKDLKSLNGDTIQSAGVYESATMQANVVVNIMCN